MTKTDQATVIAVLEALKLHGCITGYTIDDKNVRPVWCDGGFDRAFNELKTNPRPFGLKKKSERAWLMIVLARKNKTAVDDWTLSDFKETYGL
ncbi:MAG TPA: hypothetical protein VI454_05380 [Verrucomicrobiae bacterium]|jgi:hypothetical protein